MKFNYYYILHITEKNSLLKMEMIDPPLSSDQSDQYIMRVVHEPMTRSECRKAFLKLTDLVCYSEHSFLRENALAGLDKLAEMNVMVFLEFLDKSYFTYIFNQEPINPVNMVVLLVTIVSKLTKYESTYPVLFPHFPLLRHCLVMYVAKHGNDPRFVRSLLQLYTMHQVLIPQDTKDVALLGNVVIYLHKSHPSSCQCDG